MEPAAAHPEQRKPRQPRRDDRVVAGRGAHDRRRRLGGLATEDHAGAVVGRPGAARPEGRVGARAVPRQRDVDVAGVRVRAGVRLPGPAVRGPGLVVVDHVHDPEPVGHLTALATGAGAGDPGQEVCGDPLVRRVVHVEHPVPGAAVLVLRGPAGGAGAWGGGAAATAVVGLEREGTQLHDAAARGRHAGLLGLVAGGVVDAVTPRSRPR